MLQQQKKIMEYTVLFSPDEEDGGFVATVPALPGCLTQGDTLAETKARAKEAIELYLETLVERGLSLPEDTEPNFIRSKVTVQLQANPA